MLTEHIVINVKETKRGKKMARLCKDEYLRRETAAGNRMRRNAEIDTLSQEQHNALSEVCAIRHGIHSDPHRAEILFNPQSAKNTEYWEAIDTKNFNNRIRSLLAEADMPSFSWDCDAIQFEDDLSFEEEGILPGMDGYEQRYTAALEELSQLVEAWNKAVEDYLAAIDQKHGTTYAPTGALRIF